MTLTVEQAEEWCRKFDEFLDSGEARKATLAFIAKYGPVPPSPGNTGQLAGVPKPRRPPSSGKVGQLADVPPADLLTAREAAARLRCSPRTLAGHVATGALKYVTTGHGTKRTRRFFTPADLDAFVAAKSRKDVSVCPSPAIRARPTTDSISRSEVVGFSEARRQRLAAKRKR